MGYQRWPQILCGLPSVQERSCLLSCRVSAQPAGNFITKLISKVRVGNVPIIWGSWGSSWCTIPGAQLATVLLVMAKYIKPGKHASAKGSELLAHLTTPAHQRFRVSFWSTWQYQAGRLPRQICCDLPNALNSIRFERSPSDVSFQQEWGTEPSCNILGDICVTIQCWDVWYEGKMNESRTKILRVVLSSR